MSASNNNNLDASNENNNEVDNPNASIPTDETENIDLDNFFVENLKSLPITILCEVEIHRLLKSGVLKPI